MKNKYTAAGISKFLSTTLIAAAAMTSAAFASEYTTNESSNVILKANDTVAEYDTLADAAKNAPDDSEIILSGTVENPVSANGVDFSSDVILSGDAVLERNGTNFLIGYSKGDAKVTIKSGTILDFTNGGTETDGNGIVISDAKSDGTRYHGELVIDNAIVKASYFYNRNVATISGNGESISDVANLSSSNGFYIGSRPEDETGDTAVATVTINKKAFVDASGTNGVLVGLEGAGKLFVDDAKFVAKKQTVTVQSDSFIELKNGAIFDVGTVANAGTITVDNSTFTAGTIANTGNIYVSGNSSVSANISGSGYVYIGQDGTNKDLTTNLTIIGDRSVEAGDFYVDDNAVLNIGKDSSLAFTGNFGKRTDGYKFRIIGGSLNVEGKLSIDTASTRFSRAKVEIAEGASVQADGQVCVYGSNVTVNGAFDITHGENMGDSLIIGWKKASEIGGIDTTANFVVSGENAKATVNGGERKDNGVTRIYTDENGKIGTLKVENGGTFETDGLLENNGKIEVGEGSVLTANVITGTGDVVLAGTINVVESLTTGNLTIVEGAMLNIGSMVALFAAGAEDENKLSFDTLTIQFADGTVLEEGSELDLSTILADGSTGADELQNAIAAVSDPTKLILQDSKGVEYTTTIDATTGKVTVGSAIPEPSAFGLLAGLGALALVASRRRRVKKA